MFGAPRESRNLFTTRDFKVFLFLDTFCIQRIFLFCLFRDTFRIQRILPFPVSGHFPFSRDFFVSRFTYTLNFQKCLETEKRPNPLRQSLFSRDFVISPLYRHFLDSKVSGNRKNDQILWENYYFQEILSFPLSLDTFDYKKMSKNMRNNNIAWRRKKYLAKGILLFLQFLDTFYYTKCQET